MAVQKPWAKLVGTLAAHVQRAAASESYLLRSAASGPVAVPLFESFLCRKIENGLRFFFGCAEALGQASGQSGCPRAAGSRQRELPVARSP